MNRRRFLVQAALASQLRAATGKAKSDRIGISSSSFHNFFTKTHDENSGPLAKGWDLREFPAMMADRYGVHQLEMVAIHFESQEPSYIAGVKASLARAHSQLVNIPVDTDGVKSTGGLSGADAKVREIAITAAFKWIDIAQELGAKSVRCNPGKMNRADLSLTISSYKKLASYAALKNMYVLIENHSGVGSEHPEDLVKIFEAAGTHCGALPNLGQPGLRLLYPFAHTVAHVEGLKLNRDFAQAIQEAKQAGFKGVFSIEYDGPGDPHMGVQQFVDELNRYL